MLSLLITPLIATHESPSRSCGFGFRGQGFGELSSKALAALFSVGAVMTRKRLRSFQACYSMSTQGRSGQIIAILFDPYFRVSFVDYAVSSGLMDATKPKLSLTVLGNTEL